MRLRDKNVKRRNLDSAGSFPAMARFPRLLVGTFLGLALLAESMTADERASCIDEIEEKVSKLIKTKYKGDERRLFKDAIMDKSVLSDDETEIDSASLEIMMQDTGALDQDSEDYDGLAAVADIQHALHEAGVSERCLFLGETSRRLDTAHYRSIKTNYADNQANDTQRIEL